MEKAHIIFDLDGTLIDSRQEIETTYKKVCQEIVPARPVDFDKINYGQTLPSILSFIYGDDGVKIALARQKFIAIYDSSAFTDTTLYGSVPETLRQLHEAGYTLHIATNKRRASTVKILKAKGLLDYFTGIITSDRTEGQIITKQEMVKALCDEHNIKKGLMVGDGDQDMEAGHLNNLTTVAALYGYEKKEILLEKNPKFTIDQFAQLNTILSKNI